MAGKGAAAAGTSAMTRFFVEARSWDGAGPGEVLARTGAMLRARLPADTFVTAFMAVLREGELRYANAGHLPPLLMRAGWRDRAGAGARPAAGHRRRRRVRGAHAGAGARATCCTPTPTG